MHHNNLDSQTVFSHACQIATSMIWLAEAINYMIYNGIQVFRGNYPKPQYLNIRICLISDLKMVLNARFEITAPLSNSAMTISVFLPFHRQMESKAPLFHSERGKMGQERLWKNIAKYVWRPRTSIEKVMVRKAMNGGIWMLSVSAIKVGQR